MGHPIDSFIEGNKEDQTTARKVQQERVRASVEVDLKNPKYGHFVAIFAGEDGEVSMHTLGGLTNQLGLVEIAAAKLRSLVNL